MQIVMQTPKQSFGKLMRLAVMGALMSMLFACASVDSIKDETRGWSVQQLKQAAQTALAGGDYEHAIRYYEILESRYPLGKFAQQAQLDMIYAYYKSEEPESAVIAAERFIKLYPRHPHVDYAYYIKGLADFNQNFDLLQRYLPIDNSERDQAASLRSFRSLSELLRKYPDSEYADDTRQRLVYLRNNLAAYELHVADYYMRRQAYLAAAQRAQYVVQHYDRTIVVPDALVIMVSAYKEMAYLDLAKTALQVLRHNYPNHVQLNQLAEGLDEGC